MSNQANYECQQISFDIGDHFFLLTDGIVEATNSSAEEFGSGRIKNLVEQFASEIGPKHIYKKLMSQLDGFTGSRPLTDDVTFVAIKIR